MTFAARTFQGMNPGGPVPFSLGVTNVAPSTGIRSGSFTLNSDGTTSKTPSGVAPSWYSPAPTTGAATGYYCALVINSSAGTTVGGPGSGVVVAVSGASWSFTNTSANVEGSGTATLYVYADVAGTQVLTTNFVSWDVGYQP